MPPLDGDPLDRDPPDRDPLDRDPPGWRPSLDGDPPLDGDHPGQRPPWTETSLDRDRDPPTVDTQTPVKT